MTVTALVALYVFPLIPSATKICVPITPPASIARSNDSCTKLSFSYDAATSTGPTTGGGTGAALARLRLGINAFGGMMIMIHQKSDFGCQKSEVGGDPTSNFR